MNEARHDLPVVPQDNPLSTATESEAEQTGTVQPDSDQFALDDAENPLQLLARASNLQLSSPRFSDVQATTPSTRNAGSDQEDRTDVNQFFLPMNAVWDVDGANSAEGFDPIDLGLATLEEAEMLFSLYEFAPWDALRTH